MSSGASRVTAVDGHYQIGIYSVRPIEFGEEITFDYNSVTEVCFPCPFFYPVPTVGKYYFIGLNLYVSTPLSKRMILMYGTE